MSNRLNFQVFALKVVVCNSYNRRKPGELFGP
jgi:hypothetical protein